VWAVPHLCGFYPDICLTTEEKAWNNLKKHGKPSRKSMEKIIKKTKYRQLCFDLLNFLYPFT
jgi:hypothetical protein